MDTPQTPKTKDEVVKDFRTREILEAARRVIAELGYAGASTERIAQEAGISKGTIYLYFKNKEALLSAVFQHGFEVLMARTRAATQRARGSAPKLRALVQAFLEHTEEHQAFYQALQGHPDLGPEGNSEVSEQIRKMTEEYVVFVAGLLERGVRAGELRAIDAQLCARFLMQLLRGIVLGRVREPSAHDPEREIQGVLDFFFHGVGQESAR